MAVLRLVRAVGHARGSHTIREKRRTTSEERITYGGDDAPAGAAAVGSVEDRSLQERLAGSVSEQLGLFAERMREGLLAASVAIGLEVMGELVEAEVSELAGPKGKHDPGRECVPARERDRAGDVGRPAGAGAPAAGTDGRRRGWRRA